MIKKFTVLLIIIIFTTSCGFIPIYSSKNINSIYIEKLNFTGDRTLNNYLKSNLNRYKKNEDTTKKISLEVVTDYQKITLSKDATGTVNKYELVAQVIFTIVPSGQELVFKQRKIMENTNNKSDEKDFENSTKKTFANIITNELILQLVTIQ
jgi:outer membrane lipopolysaccharide assembly protein LptE/RlpB|tara:strand:- start:2018 stop:2473 length:456 start_codon:yes stop_codon:yes gene_type:complete